MKSRTVLARESDPEGWRENKIPAFATDSLSYCTAYAEAMERYRPPRIRFLFIAEAPPVYHGGQFLPGYSAAQG